MPEFAVSSLRYCTEPLSADALRGSFPFVLYLIENYEEPAYRLLAKTPKAEQYTNYQREDIH